MFSLKSLCRSGHIRCRNVAKGTVFCRAVFCTEASRHVDTRWHNLQSRVHRLQNINFEEVNCRIRIIIARSINSVLPYWKRIGNGISNSLNDPIRMDETGFKKSEEGLNIFILVRKTLPYKVC